VIKHPPDFQFSGGSFYPTFPAPLPI